jgi:hypothetical protein
MFNYHLRHTISLGDIGNHIWTYLSSSKIEKIEFRLCFFRCWVFLGRHLWASKSKSGPVSFFSFFRMISLGTAQLPFKFDLEKYFSSFFYRQKDEIFELFWLLLTHNENFDFGLPIKPKVGGALGLYWFGIYP